MCNVFHAQTLYVTADILSGSGAEHSSEMKFGQSAHRTQRVGIQYLRQMTVDVHYYVLNHLMMKAACLLLLPPSVQCGNRGHRTICVNYGGCKNMLDCR